MQLSVREWFSEMRERVSDMGLRGLLYIPFTIYLSLWYGLTSRCEPGQNVFDEEWDLLIVLDACRVDTLREVMDEYEFIEEVDTRWSVGTQSAEWMAKTFTKTYSDEINKTTYISGNPFSDKVIVQGRYPPANNTIPFDVSSWNVVGRDDFYELDLSWKRRDDTYKVVLPDTLTNRVIKAGRERDQDRIIVHYMQPHLPYIGGAIKEDRPATETEAKGYELMERGDVNREDVYPVYRETLRYVLDEVEELLDNVDAERVAITADHGEAFGEMAQYGHPEGLPFPIVKRVPWVETSAQDLNTRDPDVTRERTIDSNLEDHLRDLGYAQ
ncbi:MULTISPECIES: LTA synthase family protein [Haloferax]|uniref:Sulfatase N-terminal domain-containing protein n=1 Tax=Haloferax marinum TaxID=2666143 RepID=A0A6A8G2A4_9EURY|nr:MULTISPECIES: LTA synthase family protein [Haloferax]KAB1196266.1 LTA synthase family protein [Haloferax sp. CBA1150]MRW95254.1 hypothetical protein [Haloferax marinum]